MCCFVKKPISLCEYEWYVRSSACETYTCMCVCQGTSSADQPGTSARVCLRGGLPMALPARHCHQPVIDSPDKRRGSLQILPAHVTLNACLCARGSQRTAPMHVTLTLSASYRGERRGKDAVSEMKDCLKYKMDLEDRVRVMGQIFRMKPR